MSANLTVGNVVSAAVRLYRSHFKQYLGLSLQGTLWSLVPVYGWAKACTIYAIISRLAFGELVDQPEALSTTRTQLKPRLWQFLLVQILVVLILYAINFGLTIVQTILVGSMTIVLGQQSPLTALANVVLQIASLSIYFWFTARLFIPELPLAIEDNVDAPQGVSRSWDLTKTHGWRLLLVLFLAYLITLPLVAIGVVPFIIGLIAWLTLRFTPTAVNTGDLTTFAILIFVGVILMLLTGILVNPFWQSMKAVIYYDLRSRREGLGLKLRDRDI